MAFAQATRRQDHVRRPADIDTLDPHITNRAATRKI
jgi:hypothetical protein